jgi:ribonuclease HII
MKNLHWYTENNIDIDKSIGIDEVGRGPLAGPVISSAVWISQDAASFIKENESNIPVRDSKKTTKIQRRKVVDWVKKYDPNYIKYSIGSASVEEIDNINILNATMLSMRRAYETLNMKDDIAEINMTVLVDGNKVPELGNVKNVKAVIKGDDKVLAISLASIIAKEYRDKLMIELSKEFPQYSWDTNVGYGSKAHLDAIDKFGITTHHRKSFLSKIIN